MPDADQATVVERVRAMPGGRDAVVIVLFDSMDHVDAQRLRKLDVQAWLSKTRTTRQKLAQTINGLVAKRPPSRGDRNR